MKEQKRVCGEGSLQTRQYIIHNETNSHKKQTKNANVWPLGHMKHNVQPCIIQSLLGRA